MRNFACTHCGNKVHFENVRCLQCGHALGFDARKQAMLTLSGEEAHGAHTVLGAGREGERLSYCGNAQYGVCNWLTPALDASGLCIACDLNRTIPNLSEFGGLEAWRLLERAKKRLVYCLLRFGLPLDATATGRGDRLAFDFVRDATTGHVDGLITIDVMETDAVERERQRQLFGEPYRALLGHLRHESGHFYWKLLVDGSELHGPFRALFGDESQDYAAAIQRHHSAGPASDWQQHHVSAYASSHPWEDWAETWAHYLHMVSAVDTAEAAGMEPRAVGLIFGALWPFKTYDVYREQSFDSLMERWVPLSIALNSLSRCMGHDDFYPFVIPVPAYEKLAFVHDAIRRFVRGH